VACSVSRGRSAFYALLAVLYAVLASIPARAHVGSPDVYADGSAGPYKLFVTIRPPLVIPGVAEIEVRADASSPSAPKISGVEITPIPLTGEASKHPPVPDAMKQSPQDKQFFTGALWIMATGSWQVRFLVHGDRGDGVLSIPVPATARSLHSMQASIGMVLGVLGLFLILGLVGIVGAAVQDAQRAPGAAPSPAARKRARLAMTIAAVVVVAGVALGDLWWKAEAKDYAGNIYKPLVMQAELAPGNLLKLSLTDPGWLAARKLDDFVLDHDHLMHLYLIRQPGLDVVFHLHPDQTAPGQFQLALPSIPAGTYSLYADVVHVNGFPETLVASLTIPAIAGRPLAGDDSEGQAQPLSASSSAASCPKTTPSFRLPDGYTMIWDNPQSQPAKTPEIFTFSLLSPDGKPAPDTALYMGMLGHAAFVKTDGTVFAHVHPSGTVSMAALMMAAAQNGQSGSPPASTQSSGMDMASMPGMKMPGMDMSGTSALPNSTGFPYGFPTPGAYRIFVQMKHSQTIETAAFDACAAPAQSQ
jgi:hypothetical protein